MGAGLTQEIRDLVQLNRGYITRLEVLCGGEFCISYRRPIQTDFFWRKSANDVGESGVSDRLRRPKRVLKRLVQQRFVGASKQ